MLHNLNSSLHIQIIFSVDDGYEQLKDTYPYVTSDGKVSWYAPAIFNILCRVDVRHFPFDSQVCEIRLGSWVYNGLEIDLYPDYSSETEQDV